MEQRTIDTQERLPLLQTIPLSLQHLFAMFGSTVLVPMAWMTKLTRQKTTPTTMKPPSAAS